MVKRTQYNPKRLSPSAQGCCTRPPWGMVEIRRNAEGVTASGWALLFTLRRRVMFIAGLGRRVCPPSGGPFSSVFCKGTVKAVSTPRPHGPPTEGGTSRRACYKHDPPTEGKKGKPPKRQTTPMGCGPIAIGFSKAAEGRNLGPRDAIQLGLSFRSNH